MNAAFISRLKQRLTEPLAGRNAQLKMAPSFRPDLQETENTAKAGVLLLLYPNPIELYLVFIKRTEYPGVHSAQISFPGGKFERSDNDLIHTAIRETQEEIGVDPSDIDILGKLSPLYIPVSEMKVYPTVAFTPQQPTFKIAPDEVDYIIEEPLDNLLKSNITKTKPYDDHRYTGTIPYYDIQGNHVWGATAMILSEFMEAIKSAI